MQSKTRLRQPPIWERDITRGRRLFTTSEEVSEAVCAVLPGLTNFLNNDSSKENADAIVALFAKLTADEKKLLRKRLLWDKFLTHLLEQSIGVLAQRVKLFADGALFDDDDYKKIAAKKDRIYQSILNIHLRVERLAYLESAFDENSHFGKLFWVQRGAFKPTDSSGTLETIKEAIYNLRHEIALAEMADIKIPVLLNFKKQTLQLIIYKKESIDYTDFIANLNDSNDLTFDQKFECLIFSGRKGITLGIKAAFKHRIFAAYLSLLANLLNQGLDANKIIALLDLKTLHNHNYSTYVALYADKDFIIQQYLPFLTSLHTKHKIPCETIQALLKEEFVKRIISRSSGDFTAGYFRLIDSGLMTDDDYELLSSFKVDVRKFMKTLSEDLLVLKHKEALTEGTPLNKFFSYQRGFNATNIHSGNLAEIQKKLSQLEPFAEGGKEVKGNFFSTMLSKFAPPKATTADKIEQKDKKNDFFTHDL